MSVPGLFSLVGKTVVVTGGGKGIGRGISDAMARCGANVVVSGRGALALDETVRGVQALGAQALAVVGDITRSDDRDRLIAATLERFGAIDGWVNNAGSASPADVGPLDTIGEAQWDRVVDLNLKAAFFAAQAAARAMVRGGSIVNISSRSASYPNPGTGHYGAAKAALENLTRTMAAEWGHRGIRVNAVAPGVVMTDELAKTFDTPERIRRQVQTVPLQRLGRPEDVGPLCAYLVSDASAWTSGTVIGVNGGSFVPMGYLSYLHQVNRDAAPA
ncbi:SDR family oxidoreductase [Hydrogenophaga sp. YM1]|uniref:SDR family NAD(P)-dependent oxidoreductase n=1 Tax=Hydrogenophaga TaxID=47420 RepID=UPI00086F094B|nr:MULTISPECIES: SDR family NAD(P)-dependent oxidoreductase [unclassified Hydrogenophaga]MBN9370642.1 SDR family oxidoreductase [Hydrogenophaga sp.]ODT31722.1 MAG: short-chain dehydrogenase [Hydrogenophaga sp. SCN 70-13]QRR33953.1 SDR family oxidoreductase [Hydrogenophaga sp. YM1]